MQHASMKFENYEFHSSLRVAECQGEVMSVGMCADEERSAGLDHRAGHFRPLRKIAGALNALRL